MYFVFSYLEAQLLESAMVKTDEQIEKPLSSILGKQYIVRNIQLLSCIKLC